MKEIEVTREFAKNKVHNPGKANREKAKADRRRSSDKLKNEHGVPAGSIVSWVNGRPCRKNGNKWIPLTH